YILETIAEEEVSAISVQRFFVCNKTAQAATSFIDNPCVVYLAQLGKTVKGWAFLRQHGLLRLYLLGISMEPHSRARKLGHGCVTFASLKSVANVLWVSVP